MLWVLAKRERTMRAHFMNCNNSKWMRWSESPIENFSVLIFALLRQVWKGMSKRWAILLIHTLSLDLPTDFHAVYMRSEIYLLPQCICTNRKILWASIWELQWMCVCVCLFTAIPLFEMWIGFSQFPMRPVWCCYHCVYCLLLLLLLFLFVCLVSLFPFWTHHPLHLCIWLKLQAVYARCSLLWNCTMFPKTDEHLNNQNCVYTSYFQPHTFTNTHTHTPCSTDFPFLQFLRYFFSFTSRNIKMCSAFHIYSFIHLSPSPLTKMSCRRKIRKICSNKFQFSVFCEHAVKIW